MTQKPLFRRLRRARRGMTLIEIIVVITILALLTAAVSVAVIPRLEAAKCDRAKQDIAAIMNALKIYYAKKGNYPDTGTGLKALVDMQILEKITDPWDAEYVYVSSGGKPTVTSYAKDKSPGGEKYDADVTSANLDSACKDL